MNDIFNSMKFLPVEQTPLANTEANVKTIMFSDERKAELCQDEDDKLSCSAGQSSTAKRDSTSRGYSFDLNGGGSASGKKNSPNQEDDGGFDMKRTTVLTGNHGKKQRARANTDAD